MIDLQHPLNVCRASAGTGKTYTLAAYYIGLLLSGEDYRSILAVTFTNKATAEMSERILGYLHGISEGKETAFLLRAREFMIRNRQASDAELRRRAGECFRQMLLDYDNVQIRTIDSFLQTLLSGLASLLHMSAGLNTELDIDHVIHQAVDQLLTTDLTEADRAIMEDYLRIQLDNEAQWDVRENLCRMAKELYNESVQMLDADDRILFDADAINARRERLEQRWASYEGLQELKDLLSHCHPETYNRYTSNAYDRLVRSVENPAKVDAKDRFRGVTEKSCNADEMMRATELAARVGRYYNTIQLTLRFSRDMQLMASLKALIQRNLAEANCALLAKTASTLRKALYAGDADFILEKAGIRYRHILMDEFQDTSRLQWQVMNELLRDVLAGEGHTLLVVGDIKQSIYRWRNGDWHIMASLGADEAHYSRQLNTAFPNLTRNYRSREEVVRFNLSLFRHIIEHYALPSEQELIDAIYDEGFTPEHLEQFYQSDTKQGGYVRFRAFPKGTKEEMTMAMFDAMEDLLAKGARPSDFMVLVREKKEANLICDLHAEIDAASYPLLSRARIVSADSFVVGASRDVRTVIAGLRLLLQHDQIAAELIEMNTGIKQAEQLIHNHISLKTPLYEAVSEMIKLLLTDEEGRYTGSETAYLNSLLDRTRMYVSAYGSHLEDFLSYWEDTMHAKPIPAAAGDAIRILTVHASKGLQSQTLFVPFCTWTRESSRIPQKVWCQMASELNEGDDYLPIHDSTEMANSDYQAEHDAEHLNLRVDNLNMLYVALTRAEDNLYVFTSYSVTTKGNMGTCTHVGRYIMDFVGEDDYEAGVPVIKGERLTVNGEGESIQAELWANSDQVRFVQSQEGALYTDYGEEAYRRVARMDEGILCHEIFAHLRKADELDAVLDEFESRGEIDSPEKKAHLRQLISRAWEGNAQMREWFTAPYQLKLEEAIYIDHRELRPDRVMINPETGEAIVLDYKFGHWEDSYKTQVRQYMDALRGLGHNPVRGFLWFAKDNTLIPVHG